MSHVAPALGLLAREVGVVLDRRAEAGRADQGAVAAGEAALGDVVPARMLEVVREQVAQVTRLHLAAHPRRGAGDRTLGRVDVGLLGRDARAAPRAPPRRAPFPTSTSRRCSPSRISVSARS